MLISRAFGPILNDVVRETPVALKFPAPDHVQGAFFDVCETVK
jgi:hypothetical protein